MNGILRVVLAIALLASLPLPALGNGALKAGVGVVDSTWSVGSCAGQYCDVRNPDVLTGDLDPHAHNRFKSASYGVQSRLTTRALVVEGPDGTRVALVKTDNYLAQDLMLRRAAQLLEERGSSISYDQILHAATHNHTSPYYATPAWGVWIFQDVFDLRHFEFAARAMADAITAAEADLRPARMGATTVVHDVFKGNVAGERVADDGSPAGYPRDFGDLGLVVMRFDALDGSGTIGTFVNWGQHPEGLDGYDLISADFLGPFERMVEEATGAPVIFSQGDVGSAEGPYRGWSNATPLPSGEIRAWAHVGFAQVERGARYLAEAVVDGFEQIGRGEGQVQWSTDAVVDFRSVWVPGPVSHPYPSVSNCKTDTTTSGHPGAPVVGLPDCGREGRIPGEAQMLVDNLEAHGIPVPDHYDAPGFAAVEENLRLRLQAFRVGEVLLASCACEAQVDLILNLETRTDTIEGNLYLGYDWAQHCEPGAAVGSAADWVCHQERRDLEVTDAAYQRMVAQVHNDAAGWDAPENALAANSEPDDLDAIWGNFTHTELPAGLGYLLPVGVGHAGDYNGYTVSYREYMAYDHYRKALTSYGPHTADYMVTRLVGLAREMKDPDYQLAAEANDAQAQADEARQQAIAIALGNASGPAYDAYLASLPDDVGQPEIVIQPTSITRFDGAHVTWRGGSNAIDNPVAHVERRVDGQWVPFGGPAGETWTMTDLPDGVAGAAASRAGRSEWLWTAGWEAFSGFPAGDISAPTRSPGGFGSTPEGTYRFVVEGRIRSGGETVEYQLESDPFEVRAWDGIEVQAVEALADGSVAVDVAPVAYPATYDSPFPYVADGVDGGICDRCSFRPWATTAGIASVTVTVTRAGGLVEEGVPATFDGTRWIAAAGLAPGDTATVAPGGVVDTLGNVNG